MHSVASSPHLKHAPILDLLLHGNKENAFLENSKKIQELVCRKPLLLHRML